MKKLLALVLAAIMALSILPTTAFAAEEYVYEDVKGTVYISISDDDKYVISDGAVSGTIMAYVPIDIAKLRDIKLENYSDGSGGTLEDFYYDADGNEKYEITVLQLYLYVLDTYYHGTAKELEITGSAGSLYMQNGFWGHDQNLTYYVNGAYPLEREGWGATADRISVSDGTFVDLSMYTSWSFYSDDRAGYHYFEDSSGITHEYSAEIGKPLAIKYTRAWGNLKHGGATERVASANSTIYYGKTLYDEETAETVTTDADGKANITFTESGTYYLWGYGEFGTEESGCENEIVSSPSYCKVVVSSKSSSDIVYGDINGDGKVDSLDAMLIYACHNGKKVLLEEQRLAADVNGDGKVDSFDAMLVYAYHNGKINKFPVENK